jgi:hypothetical protein
MASVSPPHWSLISRSYWPKGSGTLNLMKRTLSLIGALILAGPCISACPAIVAVVQKESTPSSLAETGAKQAGEHVAKGMESQSPTPTPTPTPVVGQ